MARELKCIIKYLFNTKEIMKEQNNKNDITYEKQIANPILSVIALNVNGLNTTIKCQRLANGSKNMIKLYAFYKRHTLGSKSNSMKVKEQKNIPCKQ